MAQFDLPDLEQSDPNGQQLAEWLNTWKAAVQSGHSGPTRPTYVVPGMTWVRDIDPNLDLMLFDGTDDRLLIGYATDTQTISISGFLNEAGANALYGSTLV